ncbi:MAG TPA: hypothetical protein VGM09_05170, partial [Bradyrhizobium sp.]
MSALAQGRRDVGSEEAIAAGAATAQPRVSSDTPSWWALTAVAPTVRFSAFEIPATPTFLLASNLSSRTSAEVQARLTDFFFAGFLW